MSNMEERLDGYYAIRIEKHKEESLRNLPREAKRKLIEQMRKLINKSIPAK